MALRSHGPAYLRARWVALKALTVVTGFVDTPDQGRFYIPRYMNPYDYWALRRGGYEAAEARILDEEFKSDRLIIDIGSNIGYVSRKACEKVEPNGKLVCIEASPALLPYLKRNMEFATPGCEIEIIGAAIGAPESEGQLCDFLQRRNLCSSLGDLAAVGHAEGTIAKVPMRSLSSVVKQFDPEGLGFSLVCDAEGAEILILTKDLESLRLCNQISMEMHHPAQTGSEVTANDMIEILQSAGFALKRTLEDTYYFNRA